MLMFLCESMPIHDKLDVKKYISVEDKTTWTTSLVSMDAWAHGVHHNW